MDVELAGFSSIVIYDEAGGQLATRHLLDLGHRRIGFVGDLEREQDQFGFRASPLRHRGYLRALSDAGVAREPGYERTGPHGWEVARTHAHELLGLERPPTAIFAASDTQAAGVLAAARERDLRVPEDLSVIGFDDVEIAASARLTTIRQPLVESGRRAIQLVEAERADASRPPERVFLGIELVVRDTTGPPPGKKILL